MIKLNSATGSGAYCITGNTVKHLTQAVIIFSLVTTGVAFSGDATTAKISISYSGPSSYSIFF